MTSELIRPDHLSRKAVVYIRQSTLSQVMTNQESLRLQYACLHHDPCGVRTAVRRVRCRARRAPMSGPAPPRTSGQARP